MKISEAIEKAEKAGTNRGIRQTTKWKDLRIVPTDTDKCCLVYEGDKLLSSRWNPKKEDLIADDWTLA